MRMKTTEKIENYMYYIEQAPSQEDLSIRVKFSYMRAYAIKQAKEKETETLEEEGNYIDLLISRDFLWRDSY